MRLESLFSILESPISAGLALSDSFVIPSLESCLNDYFAVFFYKIELLILSESLTLLSEYIALTF